MTMLLLITMMKKMMMVLVVLIVLKHSSTRGGYGRKPSYHCQARHCMTACVDNMIASLTNKLLSQTSHAHRRCLNTSPSASARFRGRFMLKTKVLTVDHSSQPPLPAHSLNTHSYTVSATHPLSGRNAALPTLRQDMLPLAAPEGTHRNSTGWGKTGCLLAQS